MNAASTCCGIHLESMRTAHERYQQRHLGVYSMEAQRVTSEGLICCVSLRVVKFFVPTAISFLIFCVLASPLVLDAATNPVPYITEISPTAVGSGGSDFTLTVLGTGFINGQSAIFWNGVALPDATTCTPAAPPQPAFCTVKVRAAMIATPATANITVADSGARAAVSNVVFLAVTNPTLAVGTTQRGLNTGSPTFNFLVAAADFNGDGNLDLALVGSSFPSCPGCSPTAALTIMLGDGTGNFTGTAIPLPVGYESGAIGVGDFNNDGKVDLAITGCATAPCAGQAGAVDILLGDGKGNFTATASSPSVGQIPRSIMEGDFNGDGNLDLAVANQASNSVSILLGDGHGGFTATAASPSAGVGPVSLAMGDFNGDGNLDLAVLSECASAPCDPTQQAWDLNILLGDGTGNFTPGQSLSTDGARPMAVATGDFNNDGFLDLAVVSACSSVSRVAVSVCFGESAVTILLGDGTGKFVAAGSIPIVDSLPRSLAVGDINDDGNQDLVVMGTQLTILLGDGSGNFTANSVASGASGGPAMVLGDFNGDGRLDMALLAGSFEASCMPGGSCQESDDLNVYLQTHGLAISKTNSQALWVGQIGTTYIIEVTNGESTPSNGAVTVTDTLPSGLVATALAGDGWDCSNNSFPVTGDGSVTASCSRSDVLQPGAHYPRITLTANVTTLPPPPPGPGFGVRTLVNTATVAFGSGSTAIINTAIDSSFVASGPPGSLVKTHSGDFIQGETGAIYTITTSGAGTPVLGGSSGPLTITDILPAGLTATDMSGPGWSCDLGSLSCTPSGLPIPINAGGPEYSPITVTVNVAADAPSVVLNQAQLSTSTLGIPGMFTGDLTIINPPGPVARISPPSLSFTSQYVGATTTHSDRMVTLQNRGNATLSITSMTASDEFAETDNCGGSLAPSATCSISATFTPKAGGIRQGTLTIADDAPGSPQTIPLIGFGQDFTFAVGPTASATASVPAGAPATYALALDAAGGFNQSVSLTCTGAPLESTCTVNPAGLTLNPVAPTTVVVNVTTTARSAIAPQSRLGPPAAKALPLLVWLLASAIVAAFAGWSVRGGGQAPSSLRPFRQTPLRLAFVTAVLLFLTLGAISMPCCGGASSPPTSFQSVGTPAGTYNLSVTGTFTNGSTALSHSVQLTLIVR